MALSVQRRVPSNILSFSLSRLLAYIAHAFNYHAQVELEDKQRKLQSKKDGIARLRQRRTAWLATLAPDTHPAAQAGQKTPAASAQQQADLKRLFSEFARDAAVQVPAAMSQAEINCFGALFRDAIIDAEEDPEFTQMVRFFIFSFPRSHILYSRFVSFHSHMCWSCF